MIVVRDTDELVGVRQRYLEAVAEGADELVVELPAGPLGLDPPGTLAGLELSDVSAKAPPAMDVTLRAPDGPCVLAGIPLRVAARRVTVENVAVLGTHTGGIGITATDEIALRDVVVLGSRAGKYERAVVDVVAAGATGTKLVAERTVLARSSAPDAVLGCYCMSGAWFDELRLSEVAVSGTADAAVSIEAVRLLRAERCLLRTGEARVLLRFLWPPVDAELPGSSLAAPVGALLEVHGETPVEPPPLRLTDGAAVTAPLPDLPPLLAADDTVAEVAGETADGQVDAAVDAAVRRVVELDDRLEALTR